MQTEPKLVLSSPDAVITRVARSEHYVVTTAELNDAGIANDAIVLRCRHGQLVRLHRGVYLVGRRTPTADEQARAALKATGRGAVLSHRSAAQRWGLIPRTDPMTDVTVPRRTRRRHGVHIVQRTLSPVDITTKNGLPITTVARTLVDLAGALDGQRLDSAVHEAEYIGRLDVDAVDAAISRAGHPAGVGALRWCLASRRPVVGRLDSNLERNFHRLLRDFALPTARHNVIYEIGEGEFAAIDVVFDEHRLGVEVDGHVHQSARAFTRDRRRDRRLHAIHGLTVIRVTEEDINNRPAEVAADLHAALNRRALERTSA